MSNEPTPTESTETVIPFPSLATKPAIFGAPMAGVVPCDLPKNEETPAPAAEQQPDPIALRAQSLAAEVYRIAHGFGPESALAEDSHRARMAEIQRLLTPELSSGIMAVLGWAGVTLYLHQVQHALRHVVLRAEVHAPSKGRHNERVLVFADRLEELADLMLQVPKTHAEAAAWWKEREDRLGELAELPRIVAMVEKEMGGAPEVAKDHTDVEKVEGMFLGLLGIVHKQKEIIGRQEAALKQKVRS